jgi:hypothetical protein
MPIELHHIVLSKEQLARVPVQERNLFVLLGHAANEVGVLAKLFHYCAGNHFEEPVLEKAEHTQALLLGRLLTGKIYEFWKLIQNGYFGTGLSKTYRDILDQEASSALDVMKRYFSQDNLIARVRNGHAFHYDVQQIEDGFRTIVEGEALDIFLAEANANSLYAFSDTIAGRAMLESIYPTDPAKALNLLISETSRAVGWINIVAGGLMMKCLERYLGGDFYSLGARVINLEGTPSSQSVCIPYFVEIPAREDV